MSDKRIEVHTLLARLLQARADQERADLAYEDLRDQFLSILDIAFPLKND